MNNEEILDLDGQINAKEDEILKKIGILERRAADYGRDRWYNRGHHDLTTLRAELNALLSMKQELEDGQ